MIEVEIINANLLALSSYKDSSKTSFAIDTYCVLKYYGKEIARTSIIANSYEPIWNEKFIKTYSELNTKERVHNRPFFLEFFELEIYECSPNNAEKSSKIYETRIPIYNIGVFKSYKLLKTFTSSESKHDQSHQYESCRIFIRINRYYDPTLNDGSHVLLQHISSYYPMQLVDLLCPKNPLYRHLFMDFHFNPNGFMYRSGLPGPIGGELVLDRYNYVEWKMPVVCNAFGDRISPICMGQFYITDLRVIFIPTEIALPMQSEVISLTDGDTLDEKQMLYLHKYTLQLPLSSIMECKCSLVTASGSSGDANLTHAQNNAINAADSRFLVSFDLYDRSVMEFLVIKPKNPPAASGSSKRAPPRALALELDKLADKNLKHTITKLQDPLYRAGLECNEVDIYSWSSRVADYINYEIRLDSIWVRWAKYMKKTLVSFQATASNSDKAWIKRAKFYSNNILDIDYQRYNIQDLDWQFSDLNSSYNLCPTYPSILVFPGCLTDEEIVAAAAQRSIGRLPSMVWIHNNTKAALCRAAQPMAGLTGNTIEFDRKLLQAIKQSSPSGLPLRIADARPKLNANANAVQGKGFENVSYLGGPSQAALVFLDIDNIHVVRGSYNKVKEGLATSNMYNSNVDVNSAVDNNSPNPGASTSTGGGSGGSTYDSMSSNAYSTYLASKWPNHIASILRGAVGVADSLMNGNPVLVHCSDGWDRTAQLTTLAQLIIDPYYRTVEGFLALIYKEWCCFGHKFEDRSGRSGHKNEVSPVFLQFLHCVYNIMQQFPTYFEFNTNLLQYIVLSFHSGFFMTFRGNNERDRFLMMKREGAYEDMSIDDFEYANLSIYMLILLRTPSFGGVMLNVNYMPPKAHERQIQYIRPKHNILDVDIWKEGMFGLNFNILDQSIAGVQKLQQCEATAITNNFLARFMSYLDTHIAEFPQSIQNKIEVIKSTNYVCPAYPESYYAHFGTQQTNSTTNTNNASNAQKDGNNAMSTSSSIVGTIFLNYGKLPCGDSHAMVHFSNKGKLSYEECVVKIQLWYKAFYISKRALYDIISSVVPDPTHVSLSRQEKRRLRAYQRVYYLLAHSYLLHFYDISMSLKKGRELFMRKIVDDVISDVAERQARSTLALRLYTNNTTSSTLSGSFSPAGQGGFGSPHASGKHQSSSKEKSLSSRFLKAAGNALNFSMNYGTEDEGEENPDYAMEDNGASAKKSTMTSLMKSFIGGSKS